MLRHLRRLDRHPLDAIGERGEEAGDAVAVARVTSSHDDAVGMREDVDCFAEAEVLRRVRE